MSRLRSPHRLQAWGRFAYYIQTLIWKARSISNEHITVFIEFLAPASCLSCSTEGQLLCPKCILTEITPKRQTCYRCNRLSDRGRTCKSCQSSSSLYGVAVAAHYDGAIKQLIWKFKYERSASAAKSLARVLLPYLEGVRPDIITSVPTSPGRYRARGYNQSELLAKEVAAALKVPYIPLLARVHNVHQVGLPRAQRLSQIKDAFVLLPHRLQAKDTVLIVDDVLTTGATMNECARVLKAAGAKRIYGAVAAKH